MNRPTNRTLPTALALGTLAQVAMVLIGHSIPSIAKLFAVGGMSLSLLAGLLYGAFSPQPRLASVAVGGAIAGGLSALIGIAVSFALGDVPLWVLAFGTASSAIAGALGGAMGRALRGRSQVASVAQVK